MSIHNLLLGAFALSIGLGLVDHARADDCSTYGLMDPVIAANAEVTGHIGTNGIAFTDAADAQQVLDAVRRAQQAQLDFAASCPAFAGSAQATARAWGRWADIIVSRWPR
jgi:hypothetical protein